MKDPWQPNWSSAISRDESSLRWEGGVWSCRCGIGRIPGDGLIESIYARTISCSDRKRGRLLCASMYVLYMYSGGRRGKKHLKIALREDGYYYVSYICLLHRCARLTFSCEFFEVWKEFFLEWDDLALPYFYFFYTTIYVSVDLICIRIIINSFLL